MSVDSRFSGTPLKMGIPPSAVALRAMADKSAGLSCVELITDGHRPPLHCATPFRKWLNRSFLYFRFTMGFLWISSPARGRNVSDFDEDKQVIDAAAVFGRSRDGR